MLKICVASHVPLIWLELFTFVTLLAIATCFQAVDTLCKLWLAWGLQFLHGNWQIRICVRHKFQRNRNFMLGINSSCENGLDILCLHFHFSFRTNGKRATRWKRLPVAVTVFFFESTILKLLDQAMFKVLSQKLQDTLTTSFWSDTLQLEILRTWITIWTNFSAVNIFKRKLAKVLGLLSFT